MSLIRIKTGKKALFIILSIAFLLRIAWIVAVSPRELTSDPYFYDKTAQKIVSGDGYRNGKLFAYRPPGYPYFLAGIYAIFGHNLFIVKIIQALLSTASCIVIYLIVKMLLEEYTALLSASIFATYPQFIRYSGELWSETLFIFLFLVFLLFLFKFLENNSCKNGIIAGIALGITALTREIAFLFIGPIAIWLFMNTFPQNKVKNFLKNFSVVCIFMIITILPWVIRNYQVFHKFIPISTNGGINFYMGNNPDATGKFQWKLPPETVWPDHRYNVSSKELAFQELKVYEQGYSVGLKFIATSPVRFAKLAYKKIFLLWRPPYYQIYNGYILTKTIFRITWLVYDTILLIAMIPAIILLIKRKEKKWFLFIFWIIFISLVCAFTYYDTRYRLPLVPIQIIFTVYTFNKIYCKLFRQKLLKI